MTTIHPSVSRRTHRHLAHTLIVSAATTLLLGSPGARANDDARLDEVAFHASSQPFAAVLKVVSNNGGKSWDTILAGQQLGFGAHIKIETKGRGYVERVGLFLGDCTGSGCGQNPRVMFDAPRKRDYKGDRDISFSASKLGEIGRGGIGGTYRDMVLALCNTDYSDASIPHNYTMKLDVTMSANTRTGDVDRAPSEVWDNDDTPFDGGDVTRHSQFDIYVSCLATRKNTSEPKPNDDPQRTKVTVTDLDLFLTTYTTPKGSQRGPSGTQCDPLKVTTRLGTDKAGPVNVKLWRQVNGGAITSEQKQMHAAALGGDTFGDDWNKFEQFSQTTTVQYKAEILGGTFAPSTPWKSITIHCNGDFKSPTNDQPAKPKGEVRLPPTIVTPPPACGTKAAKVRGSVPCVKTAQLPDQRKQWAEQKRKEAAAQKRLAAKEADLRRREAALKVANVRQHEEVRRPMHFGRPLGGPQRGMFGGGMFRR